MIFINEVFIVYLIYKSFNVCFFFLLFLRRRRKFLIDILLKFVSYWRDILILSLKLMIIFYKRYLYILIIVKKKKFIKNYIINFVEYVYFEFFIIFRLM